jgi:hypothetical protein
MFTKAKNNFGSLRRFLVFSFAMAILLGWVQTGAVFAFQASSVMGEGSASPETIKKIEIARDQHDIIMLSIRRQDFGRIEAEWQVILDLKLGAEFENLIGQSLVIITRSLLDAKQFTLAQTLMDKSLVTVPFSNKSKADIFVCKADLYERLGDYATAIKMMEKSKALEAKP